MSLHVADDLSFPARAVTETFGILAVRGAGKSNTAAVMAEEMFKAKLPFVVVDPVRAWYGLRASADGKGPGLPIPIFGGRRGDVPLERGAGNLMADLVVDQRLSCVLDLSDFDSEGSKKQFLLDFGRRLYQRNEQPLHLFLEEADDYIPQRPMRDEAQLLRAWENIVRREETLDCLGISESTYFRLITAGVVPGPEGRGCVMITPIKIQGLDLGEFFRTLTFGSPEWVRRMEREVRAGNKQTIKLLEAYLLGLPQSLREAVLAVRVIAAPQVRKDAEVVFQTRTP